MGADEDRQLQRSDSLARFRLMGKVVMAIQRFKASINPTYNYGKRQMDAAATREAGLREAHAQRVATGRGSDSGDRTASGRTVSGRPTNAGQAHGHKGTLLFRPLPAVKAEAQ